MLSYTLTIGKTRKRKKGNKRKKKKRVQQANSLLELGSFFSLKLIIAHKTSLKLHTTDVVSFILD